MDGEYLEMRTSTCWNGKRVLVTGAAGFMGSHLTERLLDLGAKVSVFLRGTSVNGTTQHSTRNIGKRDQKRLANRIYGDIGSNDSIGHICDNSPEVIFHLAANAYVPFSFHHPHEVTQSNLIGTLNVLEAARCIGGIERIVVTSSSEIYGTAKYVPMDEKHPLNPTSPYAASKLSADRYCYSYWRTYQLPVAIIRPFNTYGPRHVYDVIPYFIELALNNRPLTVHGTGEQRRDFTYVSDMVDAFLVMGEHQAAIGQEVNFGTGMDWAILDIAKRIKAICDSESEIVFDESRVAEVDRLCCDATKAKELFGWEARVDIDEGLKRNIEWAKHKMSNAKKVPCSNPE